MRAHARYLVYMDRKLTPSTTLLLLVPPLLWAGNAVVGRMVNDLVPPITLNFLRWAFAFLLLMPLGYSAFLKGSGLWRQWKRYAMLGLLGVGMYNTLQYMALHSSTPINVTLVGASMPVWMLLVGFLFFGARVVSKQIVGAGLSMLGVLTVLSHGDWASLLQLRFVVGDLYMIVATIAFAFYSWLLMQPGDADAMRSNWAAFLLAQVAYGSVWSGLFAGAEWALSDVHIDWGWPLAAALAYVVVGPAVVAYRCWGLGVQRAGPATAAFFTNLTPLFAALMSSAFLAEVPHIYHGVAFVLIAGGILLSSKS